MSTQKDFDRSMQDAFLRQTLRWVIVKRKTRNVITVAVTSGEFFSVMREMMLLSALFGGVPVTASFNGVPITINANELVAPMHARYMEARKQIRDAERAAEKDGKS